MKFVDEAIIQVEAGAGGDGCLSFWREKFVPLGGPDGGNGGPGGNVYLQANENINTLIDFRHLRILKAERGQNGMGGNRTGRTGEDLIVQVPLGTTVYDEDTSELLGDLTHHEEMLLVAKGGRYGLGNAHFKSSTNRAPRKTTSGTLGEVRRLHLELKLLADVGLLGLPNAGKSTFIRSVSAAKPKVADYPFTTLYPNLGVVRVAPHKSFVVADIPGLIEGAAEGAGLGIQFLKHLMRTKILLHLVDLAPYDDVNPIEQLKVIINELQKFSPELAKKERWLVLNKIDCLSKEQIEIRLKEITTELNWHKPIYKISALKKQGTEQLCFDLMTYLDQEKQKKMDEQVDFT